MSQQDRDWIVEAAAQAILGYDVGGPLAVVLLLAVGAILTWLF